MITGFILAAGFGTRLRPITDYVPKALVSVCGKPMLQRALEFCHGQGIQRIGVNSHSFPDMMESFKDRSIIPFSLFHEKGKIRGTGGAFFHARDFLSAYDVFFVCNVDIIAQVDLIALYHIFLSYHCVAGLIAAPVKEGGTISYDISTKEFQNLVSEKNTCGTGMRADFIGMAFYTKDFLHLILPEDFSILPVWERARSSGHSVKIIEADPLYWKDAGTPKALANIHFDLLERRLSLSIPSGIVIDHLHRKAFPRHLPDTEQSQLGSNVWCEAGNIPSTVQIENSVVFADAVITPDQCIKNAIITRWGKVPF